ncbi:MAG: hypothetical protein RL186_819, partial [Pseudomonadota bacterium]
MIRPRLLGLLLCASALPVAAIADAVVAHVGAAVAVGQRHGLAREI